MAEREGFYAALILQAVSISPRKFSCILGGSKVQNGSRSGSRHHIDSPARQIPIGPSAIAFKNRGMPLHVNMDSRVP